MALALSWPSTLPQCFLLGSYSTTFVDTLLRSEVDQGPAKVRRRFSGGVRPVSGEMSLTLAQVGALRTFFETTTEGGALPFNFPDPEGGADLEVRFDGSPRIIGLTPQVYRVDISLEALP